jgi:hypothetical protein
MVKSESRRKKLKIHKKHRYMRGGMMPGLGEWVPTEEDKQDLAELEMEQEREQGEESLTPEQRSAAKRDELTRLKKIRKEERIARILGWVKSVCGAYPPRLEKDTTQLLLHLIRCLESSDISWKEPYKRLLWDLNSQTQDLAERARQAGEAGHAVKLNNTYAKLEKLIKEKQRAESMEPAANASPMQVAAPEAEAAAPAPAPLSPDPSDIFDSDEFGNSIISPLSHVNLRNNPQWQGGNNCNPAPTYLCDSAYDESDKPLSSRSCMICGIKYTLFIRKHHCRRCGISVCDNCSKNTLNLTGYLEDKKPHKYLDHDVEKDVRVCNLCYDIEKTNQSTDSVTHAPAGQLGMDSDSLLAALQADLARLGTSTGGGKRKSKRKKTQRRKKSIKKSKRRNFKKSNKKSKKRKK